MSIKNNNIILPSENLKLGENSLPKDPATNTISDQERQERLENTKLSVGQAPQFTVPISVPGGGQSYRNYINRPFSWTTDNVDDMRAHNQSFGEKAAYALPKFVTRVGTNVLGSTVGLVYGGGAVLRGLVGGDYKFNSPKAALTYITDYINSFEKKQLSNLVKRKIKAKDTRLKQLNDIINDKKYVTKQN